MSYQGFGYDFVIGTPIGNQTFHLPIEKLAQDAGAMAANAAWPPLQAKLEQEFPKLLSQAESALTTTVMDKLWPSIEPKLMKDAQTVVNQAEKTGYVIGGIIVAAIFGAAWWVKKGR